MKYKVGDRVIIKYGDTSPTWTGVIKELRELRREYEVTLDKPQIDGQDHRIEEEYVTLDIQWLREQRLNGLLDDTDGEKF